MTASVEPIAPVELRNCVSPAKINLFLHVLGKRDDGYHELETVFDLVDLCDLLHFSIRSDGAIMRRGGIHGLAHDNDLSVRAARLLAAASETRYGVDIEISKQIPMGGGLGGGSSNAATTLMALNRLWNIHWPVARLARLALQLGADVPVFVHGTAALAAGVGEKLTPLSWPRQFYVIVAPPATVPTVEIFSDPELTRDSKPLKILPLSQLTVSAMESIGHNDLESVAFARYPAVEQALIGLNKAAKEVFSATASKSKSSGKSNKARSNSGSGESDPNHPDLLGLAESEDGEQEQSTVHFFDASMTATKTAPLGSASAKKVESDTGEPIETLGASWSQGRMSGSGGCVFLPVASREQAEQIARRVRELEVGVVVVAASIKSHPMRSWAFGRGLPKKS